MTTMEYSITLLSFLLQRAMSGRSQEAQQLIGPKSTSALDLAMGES